MDTPWLTATQDRPRCTILRTAGGRKVWQPLAGKLNAFPHILSCHEVTGSHNHYFSLLFSKFHLF